MKKTWTILENEITDVFQYHSFFRQNQWHTPVQAKVWYTAKQYSTLSTYYGTIEAPFVFKAKGFAAGSVNAIGTVISYFTLPIIINYLENISYESDTFGLNTLEYYETDPVLLRTDSFIVGRYHQVENTNITKENCRNH